jgi:hypothetical protein
MRTAFLRTHELCFTVLVMTWAVVVQMGLASLIFAPPYQGAGASTSYGGQTFSCDFGQGPIAVFLHVPGSIQKTFHDPLAKEQVDDTSIPGD